MTADTVMLAFISVVSVCNTIAWFWIMTEIREVGYRHRWHRHAIESISSNRTGLPLGFPPPVEMSVFGDELHERRVAERDLLRPDRQST